MTGSMNDMHNPQSAALWQDFGTRAGQFLGGQEYWLNQGNLMGAQQFSYQGRQSQFRDGLLDPNSPSGQLFAQIPGASDNPDAAMQQMASSFATVKSPEDFKKLSPVEQQLFIQVLGKTSGAEGDLTGTRNSFDTLAVIALVEDPALRAQQMRDLYTEANDQAQMSGQDAVWQFSTFTQRFKDNPALFNLAQQSIHFDWTQEDVRPARDRVDEDVSDPGGCTMPITTPPTGCCRGMSMTPTNRSPCKCCRRPMSKAGLPRWTESCVSLRNQSHRDLAVAQW